MGKKYLTKGIILRRLRKEIGDFKIINAVPVFESAEELISLLPPGMIDPRVLIDYNVNIAIDPDTLEQVVEYIQLAYSYGSIECRGVCEYTVNQHRWPHGVTYHLSNPMVKKIERALCHGEKVFD